MKANDSIQKLEYKINACDRLLKRDANNANAHYFKGGTLVEIAKHTADHTAKILYYNQALVCFNKAIELTHEENAVYLIDRSKLHVDMGRTEFAVADVKRVSTLPKDVGVFGLYIKNTIKNIAKLEIVDTIISRLLTDGKIDSELANALQKHVKVTESLVVTAGLQDKILGEYENTINNLLDRVVRLEHGLKLSSQEISDMKSELEKLTTDADKRGMTSIAEIKQEFKALEKQSTELYKTILCTTNTEAGSYAPQPQDKNIEKLQKINEELVKEKNKPPEKEKNKITVEEVAESTSESEHMLDIAFYGNFLELIKKTLAQKYGITKENSFISNNIDIAKWEYKFDNKKLEVLLVEDFPKDKTIILSSNETLYQVLVNEIEITGGIVYDPSN